MWQGLLCVCIEGPYFMRHGEQNLESWTHVLPLYWEPVGQESIPSWNVTSICMQSAAYRLLPTLVIEYKLWIRTVFVYTGTVASSLLLCICRGRKGGGGGFTTHSTYICWKGARKFFWNIKRELNERGTVRVMEEKKKRRDKKRK